MVCLWAAGLLECIQIRGSSVFVFSVTQWLSGEAFDFWSSAFFQFDQNLSCDFAQSFEYAFALESHRFEGGLAFSDQIALEGLDRQNVGQVALVELQHVGNFCEVVAVLFEVVVQVLQGLDVRVHALFLGIGHEDHAIDAAQDQLAAGVIEDLSGDCIKVEPRLETSDGAQIERKKIEEKSSIGLGGQRDHLAFLLIGRFIENELQVRRLTAQTGAVIDDFAIDLAGRKIDKTQYRFLV